MTDISCCGYEQVMGSLRCHIPPHRPTLTAEGSTKELTVESLGAENENLLINGNIRLMVGKIL